MKFFIITTVFLFCALFVKSQSFNVATYNLRNENTYDVNDMWADRYPRVVRLIKYHEFDLFGTQEAFPKQLEDLKRSLSGYDYYGEGRDGNGQGEHAAIFYKTDKYVLLGKGDFWLSSTPEVPSKSWDAPCCNRICSWVKLKEVGTDKTFFVFNAHYDYEKDYAREQSSLLVLQKIREIAADAPAIFMGDLNGDASEAWCRIIHQSGVLRDTYFDIDEPYAMAPSYNAFGCIDNLDDADTEIVGKNQVIDHIYVSQHFKTQKWGLLTDTYNIGKFPSDHFPVVANLIWNH